MIGDEAQCLSAWMQVEPSAEIAGRLAELAAATGSRFVDAMAVHARALLDSDPVSLTAASERFAEMSVWRLAADAAAAAADIHDRRHDVRAAQLGVAPGGELRGALRGDALLRHAGPRWPRPAHQARARGRHARRRRPLDQGDRRVALPRRGLSRTISTALTSSSA